MPSIVHEVLRSPGQPLDPAMRAFLEPRFGQDFSEVRVHTDEKAAESARAVSALAYTLGRHLVFGRGQYVPGTPAGNQLLAHEATHAVQQAFRDVEPAQTLEVAPARDATEQEADRNEASATRGEPFAAAGRGTTRLARKGCLAGASCKAPIPGSNDATPGIISETEKREAALRAKGETTWEFSTYFRLFVKRVSPGLINVPTAWLVGKGSSAPAIVGYCPNDLDARDDISAPKATGRRSAKGRPDHCVFVSPEKEQEAKMFLKDRKARRIGGQSRADWEFESRGIAHHEAAHVPIRREVVEKFARGGYPTRQHFRMEAGPLNEAAGVLAELPLIFDHEESLDPWRGDAKARAAVRAKIRGPNPKGSTYTIAGLLQRACCMVSCAAVKKRIETLIARSASGWTSKQSNVIVPELATPSYCDNKLDLANPATLAPSPKPIPTRPYNPRIGPGP